MLDCSLGIILDSERKSVLLVQRKDVPVWVLPGGGIDPGETPEQAVIREVEEETGLQVSITRRAAQYSPINRFTSTANVFECQIHHGMIRKSDEAQDIAFFPLDSLPELFFLYHRHWLEKALMEPNQIVCEPMSRKTYWSIILFYLRRPQWAIRYLMTRLSVKFLSY
ncbi:MAG: NUDIX hydrolase [Chlamydiales bacterium]|nr:NUDIX hydrolase [Chlamydiales bacterium]